MREDRPSRLIDIDLIFGDIVQPEDAPWWFRTAWLLGEGRVALDEADELFLDAAWSQIAAEERQAERDARRRARGSDAQSS
jgi:hypothetical protein